MHVDVGDGLSVEERQRTGDVSLVAKSYVARLRLRLLDEYLVEIGKRRHSLATRASRVGRLDASCDDRLVRLGKAFGGLRHHRARKGQEGIDLEGELRGVGAPLHIGQIEGVERGVRIGREPDVHAAEGLDEISVLASGVEDDDLVLRIGEHCIGDLAFHREGLPGTGLAADEPHGTCELLAVADNEVARLLRLPVIAPALLVEL